jgi:flagellar biosynthesis/type III secretory pathway M-ring protein FliF/YscJ
MFDRTYFEEQAAAMAEESQTQLYLQIGLAVAAALGALFLLWYVQRLLGNLRLASQEAWTPIMMPVAALGQPAAAISAMNPALAATAAPSSLVAPAAAPEPARPSPEEEQLQRSMAKIVQESPVTLAEVIHLWLSEEEKK